MLVSLCLAIEYSLSVWNNYVVCCLSCVKNLHLSETGARNINSVRILFHGLSQQFVIIYAIRTIDFNSFAEFAESLLGYLKH